MAGSECPHGVEALRSHKKAISISFWVRFLEYRLITATLPPFLGLISSDYGDITSLSGTLPAKTGQPQFHM
eukprot:6353794-Prymnesium_polylepis.1